MALAAGRVGVNPADVDPINGHIINSNSYSESEQVIGKWIDGSPLYQKVITGTTPATTSGGEVTAISSDMVIRSIQGAVYRSGLMIPPSTYIDSATTSSVWTSETSINMKTTSNWCNRDFVLIVQYTRSEVSTLSEE